MSLRFKIDNSTIEVHLCRNCKYFTPNGRIKKDFYESQHLFPQIPTLLGDCTCPTEPPCTRLKNETNGCDYWIEKE